ncbi:Kinase, NEK [Giardia muris]|uniref:Kinase, NEK n=1 Tax=Giardia muris TaxID=5742 RepID=A0A4Z1SX54_GIAMU|nr:Kinase, NEK [Giardia muris]|eukprot:TNJ30296.1 Kinase, NEK [Giardia muris]
MALLHVAQRYAKVEPRVSGAGINEFLARERNSGIYVGYHEIDYNELTGATQELDLRNIELYAQLQHPVLIRILEVFDDRALRRVTVVTENVLVRTMADFIDLHRRKQTPIAEECVWSTLKTIGSTIAYCQSSTKEDCPRVPKIIHKYISAYTILLGDEQALTLRLKYPNLLPLLDLRGPCEVPTAQLPYLAPEILRREIYSDKVDVWSLGCVIYEMCTLQPLVKSPSSDHIKERLESLTKEGGRIVLSGYSESLESLITLMLKFQEHERISIRELMDWPDLQPLVQHPALQTRSGLYQTSLTTASVHPTTTLTSSETMHQTTSALMDKLNAVYGDRLVPSATPLPPTSRQQSIHTPTGILPRTVSGSKTGTRVDLQTAQNAYIPDPPSRSGEIGWKSALMRSGYMSGALHSATTTPIPNASYTNSQSQYPDLPTTTTMGGYSQTTCIPDDPTRQAALQKAAICSPGMASMTTIDPYFNMAGEFVTGDTNVMGNQVRTADAVSQITRTKRTTEPIDNKFTESRYKKQQTDAREAAPVVVNEIMTDFLNSRYGTVIGKEHLVDRLFSAVPGRSVENDTASTTPSIRDRDLQRHSPNDIVDLLVMKEELNDRLEPYSYRLVGTTQRRAAEAATLRQITSRQSTHIVEEQPDKTEDLTVTSPQKKGRNKNKEKTEKVSKRAASRTKVRRGKSATGCAGSCGKNSLQNSTLPTDPDLNDTESMLPDGATITESTRFRTTLEPNEEGDVDVLVTHLSEEEKNSQERVTLQQKLEDDIAMTLKTHKDMQSDDRTPLMRAAASDNVEQVRTLLPTDGGKATSRGITALMIAASVGNTRSVKVLIPREGRLTDIEGMTALMYAAHFGKVEAVKELAGVEHGHVNVNGLTALMLAVDNGDVDTVNVLKTYEAKMLSGGGETAMMRAARLGHIAVVKALVDFEARMQNPNGYTALILAIQAGRAQTSQLLAPIEKGLATRTGLTALMSSATSGNTDLARLLLDDEAGMRDSYDETALMKAAKAGALNVAHLLLPVEGGMARYDGKTALMCAADAGHTQIAEILISKEARLKRTDGTTALMCAAQSNAEDIIEMLLPMEARMQRLDGETALIRAIRWNRSNAVAALIKEEIGIPLNDGRTVLDIAKQTGNTAITDYILANL